MAASPDHQLSLTWVQSGVAQRLYCLNAGLPFVDYCSCYIFFLFLFLGLLHPRNKIKGMRRVTMMVTRWRDKNKASGVEFNSKLNIYLAIKKEQTTKLLSVCLSMRLPGLMPTFSGFRGNIQSSYMSTAGRVGGALHWKTPTTSGSKCETITSRLRHWNLFQKKM